MLALVCHTDSDMLLSFVFEILCVDRVVPPLPALRMRLGPVATQLEQDEEIRGR